MSWWKNNDNEESESIILKKIIKLLEFKYWPSISVFVSFCIYSYVHAFGYILLASLLFLTKNCFNTLEIAGSRKGVSLIKKPLYLGSSILITLSCIKSNIIFPFLSQYITIPIIGFVFIASMYSCFLIRITSKYNAILDISYTVFSMMYIVPSIVLGVLMSGELLHGVSLTSLGNKEIKWLLYLFIVTKTGDIGRWIGGKAFGSLSVIKDFDINHSQEAYLFSIIFGMGSSTLLGTLSNHHNIQYISLFMILGFILSITGIAGYVVADIIEHDAKIKKQLTKHNEEIKDLGSINIIGSLLINIPIFYFLIHILDYLNII